VQNFGPEQGYSDRGNKRLMTNDYFEQHALRLSLPPIRAMGSRNEWKMVGKKPRGELPQKSRDKPWRAVAKVGQNSHSVYRAA
jgi:hypothetical protein